MTPSANLEISTGEEDAIEKTIGIDVQEVEIADKVGTIIMIPRIVRAIGIVIRVKAVTKIAAAAAIGEIAIRREAVTQTLAMAKRGI